MNKENREGGTPKPDTGAEEHRDRMTDKEFYIFCKKGNLKRIAESWGSHAYGKKEFLDDWIEHVKMGGEDQDIIKFLDYIISDFQPRDFMAGGSARKLIEFREMVEKAIAESVQKKTSVGEEEERADARRTIDDAEVQEPVDSVESSPRPDKDVKTETEERDFWGSKFQRALSKFLRGKREGD